MTLQQTILDTLKEFHASKWVTPATAVWNCPKDSGVKAFEALNELAKKGIIERRSVNGLPLVRYIPKPHPYLKVI